jgi:hypothetical protein
MSPFSQFGDEWRRLPEARAAGSAGRDFFVCALQWCNEHRTDGLIPDDVVTEIAPKQRYPMKAVNALLEIGWLTRVRGGYQVPPTIYRRHNLFRQDLENRRGGPRRPVDKPVDSAPTAPPLDAGSMSRSRLNAESLPARCDANSAPAGTSETFAHARAPVPLAPVSNHQGLDQGDARAHEDPAVDRVSRLLDMAAAWASAGDQAKAAKLFAEAEAVDVELRKPPARAESHTEAAGGGQDARSQGGAHEATA